MNTRKSGKDIHLAYEEKMNDNTINVLRERTWNSNERKDSKKFCKDMVGNDRQCLGFVSRYRAHEREVKVTGGRVLWKEMKAT